jgi:hypothetical protein
MSDPGAGVSHYQSIERETVRLLVEALKREHRAYLPSDLWPHDEEKCSVCALIRKHDK